MNFSIALTASTGKSNTGILFLYNCSFNFVVFAPVEITTTGFFELVGKELTMSFVSKGVCGKSITSNKSLFLSFKQV